MAAGTISYYSDSLAGFTTFTIVLPNDMPEMMTAGNPHYDRPVKTLYLLHGYSGTHTDWLYGAKVQDWSTRYNLAIVMPSGENGFYLDGPATGRQFGTFVGKELPAYVARTFGLSTKREDVLIGGYSMGGFGAIHTGLMYPETFDKIAGLSNALLIYGLQGAKPGAPVDLGVPANYEYYHMVFGDLDKVKESRNNPEVLIDEALESGKRIPDMYLAIGTEDFLYDANQTFRAFLTDRKVPFTYEEGPGAHDFDFWTPYMEKAIEWMLQ